MAGVVFLLLAASVLGVVNAGPASPHPFTEIQPDGTEATFRIWGDERFTWTTDNDGFTVLRQDDGWWVYAQKIDGSLVSTGSIVGQADPKEIGLEPHLKDDAKCMEAREQIEKEDYGSRRLSTYVGTSSNPYVLHNLVVLVMYSDHASDSARTNILPTPQALHYLFNEVGGHGTYADTGSVADVFKYNSHGVFTMTSTITEWITVPYTEAQVSGGNYGIQQTTIYDVVKNAMDQIESLGYLNSDNFKGKQIPALSFAFSGYSAEFGGTDAFGTPANNRFWSQQMSMGHYWVGTTSGSYFHSYFVSSALWGTSGSSIARIGVWAHEAFHFIGLPDMYDSDTLYDPGAGVGNWDMMANMWGLDGSQYNPPNLCSWSRALLGWASPIVLDKSGTYEIEAGCYNDKFAKITHGFQENEYLIIENRHSCDLDENIAKNGGLLILHVDETGGVTRSTGGYMSYETDPNNPVPMKGFPQRHYMVAALQADGRSQLEWHNGRGNFKDLFRTYDVQTGVNAISDSGITGFDESSNPMNRAWPNTKSWVNGNLVSTGVTIKDISAPGRFMTFHFSAPNLQTSTNTISIGGDIATTQQPTASPTAAPTNAPTLAPTFASTLGPTVSAGAVVPDVKVCEDVQGPFTVELVTLRSTRTKEYENGCADVTTASRCSLSVGGGSFVYDVCPRTCSAYRQFRRVSDEYNCR